jgi:sulfoxide reductase heme-binding subunit YedZ
VFIYVAIIGVLLAWRVWNFASKRKAKPTAAATGAVRNSEKPLRTN